MRSFRLASIALVVVLFGPAAALAQTPLKGVTVQPSGPPPSAKDFTKAPEIQDVSVSPDGKHLVALTSPDGEVVDITVWDTDKLGGQPARIRSKFMRFLSVEFLKNDRLLFTAIQPGRAADGSPSHIIKQWVTDLDGKTFNPLLPGSDQYGGAGLISRLPKDPRKVLVENLVSGDIETVDVYNMSVASVMQASDKYFGYQVDLNGQLRAREYADFDSGAVFIAQQVRDPDTGKWVELFRSYAKNRNLIGIVGFTTDPNVILISSTQGGDKTGIYEYDIKQKKIIEPAFQHKLFDAEGPVISESPLDYGRILGFTYEADTSRVYWVDGGLDNLQKAAAKALGVTTVPVAWVDPGTGAKATIQVESGAAVDIASYSDDFKIAIIAKSGPSQPLEYYLLAGSKLQLLGKARPWINTATLGQTELVEYPARDGLMIPAYLTLPPATYGPGPYPTLIEPHGGPWARDEMDWDVSGWTQYFASHGFAVLQPQFRGSEGWGDKLWRAGDREWGQKMADDLDDGVKWMFGQKIADPKRVAIFGYSYGGYAALAASIRPNGLYQCAISGAGAGDLTSISYATADNRWQREYQHPAIGGLDALQHATEAKIPVLLYHGDHDVTVDPEQSRKFAAALRGAGKPVKLVEIKDMGHQYIRMTPDMLEEQLNLVDDFLKTGCKPGGL